METQVHGALVEVSGVGVLLVGPSGIGKSECALELIRRGHRLVADDLVRLSLREGDRRLWGRAPELIRHFIELRGVGILHVPDVYGETAVAFESEVSLRIRLEAWSRDGDYERVGYERETELIAGVEVPSLVLSVRPAANLATLVEVAARDFVQRQAGRNAAQMIDERILRSRWLAHEATKEAGH